MPRARFVTALLLLFVSILPATLYADDSEVRALWVDSIRDDLRSPAGIDALIQNAKSGNFNTIIAQVRRNAQSLYANHHPAEGWLENYVPPAGFDPLQYLIDKAHPEGIEVHAWVNIGATFSGHPTIKTSSFPCAVPCDPNHIFRHHGWGSSDAESWITRAHPSFLSGTTFFGQRQSPSGVWFLDLGHPDAAAHTIDVLTHLLRNYDVDGIHLDYIRYPEMPIAAPRPPGATGLGFSTGYNPTSVNRFNQTYSRPAGSLPSIWDASWSQWRRDQVSAFVRRLYLEMGFIRPSAKLSAALITFFRGPNTSEPRTFQQTEAYTRVFQDWRGWMDEGILDLSIPMIYKHHGFASHRIQFTEWAEFTKTSQYDRHGVLGLGAYMNSIPFTLAQIEEGRTPAANGDASRGFNFFSYFQTNGNSGGTARLVPNAEFYRAVAIDGAWTANAPFATAASIPAMSWKSSPRHGHLLAQILLENGSPADGALVTIRKMGGGSRDEEIVQYADGNGYVGGVDLNPGAYQLLIEIPGSEDRVTIPEPVVPGRVTRVTVDLARPARGPMARAERTLGEHERTDHLGDEASALEDWLGREPLPEDLSTTTPSNP